MPKDIANEDGTLNTEAASAVISEALDTAQDEPQADTSTKVEWNELRSMAAKLGIPAKGTRAELEPKVREMVAGGLGEADDDDIKEDIPSDEGEDATLAPDDDDDAADEPSGEGEGWVAQISGDLAELVESLQLSSEDLDAFSGPDEVERHARLLDRQLRADGRAAIKQHQTNGERDTATREEARRPRDDGRKDGEVYKPSLDPEEWSEDIRNEFTRAADRIAGLEQRLAERDREEAETKHHRMVSEFDAILDALGHDDLFGKREAIKEGDREYERREKLWDAMSESMIGAEVRGRNIPKLPAAIRRALNSEFANELSKKERKTRTAKAREQSSRKLGGGPGRTTIQKPFDGPLEESPTLRRKWRELEAETGVT